VSTRRIGRFELLEVLGRGAQSTVWLAHDPRLARDVALKLLDLPSALGNVSQWLDEGRACSRLTHPHIVQVYEADEADGQPYLVFEYVAGRTLADELRLRRVLPEREAASIMLGILDGLAAAHEQGIVHRDLKPSNVLLGSDGRARVTDFGIAAREQVERSGAIVGTPRQLSPDTAHGDAPAPAMDVFAAGLVLGEMLCGAPLITEREPHLVLHLLQSAPILLPQGCSADAGLRAIVQRALARDKAERFDGARAMHAALAEWLNPEGPASEGGGQAALEFLLRRMRLKSDFPALSSAVARIQRLANSETERLSSLSAEILRDVALTNKLLRLVNSASFGPAATGRIGTVSRAVALIGFSGVRNLAMSLVLLDHMADQAHAGQLRQSFLDAVLAGMLAADLAQGQRDVEEAYLGTVFQNLGRLLTEYYFPEEAQRIRALAAEAAAAGPSAAAVRVLGIGFDDLGVGVARAWGLPETLQRAMRCPEGETPPRAAGEGVEWLRWLGKACNQIAASIVAGGPEAEARIEAQAQAHAGVLGLDAKRIGAAAHKARALLAQVADAMGLPLARRGAAAATASVPAPAPPAPPAARDEVAQVLAAGVQDITDTIATDSFKLNDVLRMVIETMYRALDFRRIVFALRDPKLDALTVRFGLGADVDAISRVFRVSLAPANAADDLFASVCLKGADTLLADTDKVAAKLPAWYRAGVAAPTLLLLPLLMKSRPFALIYADAASAGAIAPTEKELSLLRTLRNQAVMAFRQAQK
jgi:serine/threonine protein kinase